MAFLHSRFLFFTTSPRTPAKMIPEIQLLAEAFEGKTWNTQTQSAYIAQLSQASFFEGSGSGKTTFCLFIAPTVNPAAFMHFYGLNKINNVYYGGKTKIIPIGFSQFMKLLSNAYQYQTTHKSLPTPKKIRLFLDTVLAKLDNCPDEVEWQKYIQQSVNQWLI